jgi:hypothetical protein
LNKDLQEIFDGLRNAFGFRRRDLDTRGPKDGGGSIITPYFDYEVTVSLNPEEPSEVIWSRQVVNIREPDKILTEEFDQVFSGIFDTLEFFSGQVVNIENIIDQIEDLDDDKLSVDYDKDFTCCAIQIAGLECTIHLTRETFRLVQKTARSPKLMVESFFTIQRKLIDTYELKQLPFGNLKKG